MKFEEIILLFTKNENKSEYKCGIRESKTFNFKENINKKTYTDYNIILNGVSKKEIELAYKIKNQSNSFNNYIINQRGGPFQKNVYDEGDITVLGGNEIQREGIIGIKGYTKLEYIKDCEKCFINNKSVLVQRIVTHLTKPTDHIKFTACIPNNRKHAIVDTINQITVENYTLEAIWALINSNLINWYAYKFIFGKAIRTMQFDNPTTSKIPIKENILNDETLKKKAIELNDNYNKLNNEKIMFIKWLKRTFNLEKTSQKIDEYQKLTFEEFLKELQKKKINTKSRENQELLDKEFNKSINLIVPLQKQIICLEKSINQIIYKHYSLSDEEISIIERDFQ